MKLTTTLNKLRPFFAKMLPLLILAAFSVCTVNAQQYINGNLGTGTTSKSGVAAPAGTQWHEMQNDAGNTTQTNVSIAFDNSPVLGSSRVADNFTVPAGVSWNINKMTFYAVVLPPPPGTSPITAVRVIIRDASPVGASNIIYGDLTTNRLSSSSFSNVYTIANSQVPAPGTPPNQNFVVWKVEAAVSANLAPGNYWVEWQCVGGAGQRVFALMSQPVNARTLPGYNAVSTFNGGPWQAVLDAGNPASAPDVAVDFCYGIDYVASPCLNPTASVLSQVQIPTGTLNLINEGFEGAVPPAGWATQNLSVAGTNPTWGQGGGLGVFGAQSGAGFAFANFQNTSGTNTISNWMFAPAVTLKNGDKFTFYTRTTNGAFPDRMQVRMSTNGASTNVGTTVTSVGDYTNLLLDINPTYTSTGYPTAWTQFTLTMSGLPAAGISGRLAFRYFVENGGPGGANSDFIGVDNVVYSTQTFGDPLTCTGSTANLKVDITGGNSPYKVVINAAPGGNFTINNYISGSNIPVTPAVTTTYSLVSVTGCGVGTGNSGTPTITVSPTATQPLIITAAPSTTLCAGDPTLLSVTGAPTAGTSVTASGPISVPIPDNSPAGVSTTLNVAGIPGTATATGIGVLFNITHTWDGDLTIFLKSPNNQVLNLVNARGGSGDNFVNTNITSTATVSLPTAAPFTGTFIPEGSLSALAPTGYTPTATNFTPLYATNGTWGLGVRDAAATDVGTITDWTLTINYAIPAGPLPGGYTFLWSPAAGLSNTTSNPTAASPMTTTTYTVMGTAPGGCQTTTSYTVNVNQLPAITSNPSNLTVCDGTVATFTAVGTGAGAAFQWQVSTNNGTSWTNIPAGAPYSGINSATLTINPASTSMNGYRYRMVVTGTCPPAVNSTGAILTVNSLPVIAYTPASPICGGIAGVNGTQITAGSLAPPIPGSVTVSSGAISIPVPDNSTTGASHTLNVAGVPANATVVGARVTFNMPHTWNGDMIFNLKAPNGTVLNLDKYLTGTGGAGPTTGFVNTVISSAGSNALSTGTGTYTGTFRPDLINNAAGFTIQNPAGFVSTATAFFDLYSTPNGPWTLAMADGGGGDLGTLTSWSLVLDYTTPGGAGNPLTYTWSPAAGLYNNSTANSPYVAGTQTGTVYAAPAANTVYTITGTNGISGCQNSATVQVVYTPAAPVITPAAPAMCLGDVAIPLSISSSLAPSPFTSSYSSGPISVPIISTVAAGATNTIAVPLPATAQITRAQVAINLTHTWDGDMAISLKAPNGQILNLDYYISNTGGTGSTTGFTNTRFASDATTAISSSSNPYTGIFKADAQLVVGGNGPTGPTGMTATTSNWSGLYSIPNGNWTIGILDNFAGDDGTLTSWSLTFDYLYGPPAPGVWTPNGAGSGLYLDPLAQNQYTGTSVNTVYAKPGATTTYGVTVTSVGFDATKTFTNTAPIAINDAGPGSPYPASITVSGLPTIGAKVQSVKISGISHTWSDDIDILLQSPTGTNVTLMSDVGGAGILNNVDYTFNDAAAASMNFTAANATGTYKPTNNGAADTYAAPVGAITDATPALANFTGDPNGTWKLFVMDDTGGDFGSIGSGYNITFVYPTTGCTSAPKQVTVTVNIPVTITTQPVNASVCTDKVTSFTVVAAGTSPTYRWQVSTDNGNNFANVSNGGVYAGATTATLTITAPPVSMSGYLYRCVVTGTAPCGSVNSAQRLLTVNPLPTITIAASLYKKLFPGLRTTLSSTVSPVAATNGYTWLKNGTAVATGSASSLVVDIDGLGDYTLRVTDVNGCTNTSNLVSITDSVTGKVFIYPNPNSGQFQVRYHSVINNTGLPRGVNVYDARGKRIVTKTYSISAPYGRMDIDLRNHGTGVYWIEVVDVSGNRLAMGRAEVLR